MSHSSTKKLGITLFITFLIFVAELVGGILSNSLALLSDAAHVFTDSFALILSLIASLIMRRPSGKRATYGYQKVGILAALINGVSLIIIALMIFLEGYKRLVNPPSVDYQIMLPVAVFGFIGNLVMALILGHKHEDLNIQSAWLHVLGDTLSSAGVIIASIIITYTGWLVIDPLVSWFVGFIIIFGGIRVVKESFSIFLDLVPKGLDLIEIIEKIRKINGIVDVHDVHIWSIGYGIPAFSAHVVVNAQLLSEADQIRKEIEKELIEFGIKHIVIQVESVNCINNSLYCKVEESHHH